MTIDLNAPMSWRELTLDQLRMVATTFRLQLTREEMLLVLLCQLTGIRLHGQPTGGKTELFVTAEGQVFTMQDYEIEDFCNRLQWLFDEQPCDIVNPTKADGHMRGVKFGDWFRADALFYDLSKGRTEAATNLKDMHQALALLGHNDKAFPKDDVEYDMVLLWWNGVGNMLKVLYPNVFASEGEPAKNYSPFKNLQNIHLMLNDCRPQDNEAIYNCDLHDVLSALDCKIGRLKRETEAYDKMKNGHKP